ncbi:MAG TPA: DUF2851 family protein [Cyclobacteriaceae bacterium]|nr:DUF2851 family protein [Cyclobacteriaceae bacterium]
MTESFIHYVWQFQYFDRNDLRTTKGESLRVLKTGFPNSNAGPDFFNAKINIDGIELIGNVEIHIKSSDWYAHRHEKDAAYNTVILHVVWENDKPVTQNGVSVPTLELKLKVNDSLLQQYRRLVNSSTPIACEKSFYEVGDVVKFSMLDKALMQRLEKKADHVRDLLKFNGNDWEETTYQLFARNFGFKVNADPFFQLSKVVPYKIIQKQNGLLQVEALLFGQAGMLDTKTKDEYVSALFREYHWIAQKYALHNLRLSASQWRFLRLRPANFPTLRIAQFAAMLFQTKNIFSQLMSTGSYPDIRKIIEQNQSGYWQTHYHFGGKAKRKVAGLGKTSTENIVINTVAPLLVAYGKSKDDQAYIDRAVEFLQQLPAEENRITKMWNGLGLKTKNAFDSQATIELHNAFCQGRQCLNCNIGVALLKPTPLC